MAREGGGDGAIDLLLTVQRPVVESIATHAPLVTIIISQIEEMSGTVVAGASCAIVLPHAEVESGVRNACAPADSIALAGVGWVVQSTMGTLETGEQEPLKKIRKFGDWLERVSAGDLGGKPLMYLDRMLDAAERMQRLIDDLLAYSCVGSASPWLT